MKPLRERLSVHRLALRAEKRAIRLEAGHVPPQPVQRPPRPDLGDVKVRKTRRRLRSKEIARIARKRDLGDAPAGGLFRLLNLSLGGAKPKKKRARKTRQATQRRGRR